MFWIGAGERSILILNKGLLTAPAKICGRTGKPRVDGDGGRAAWLSRMPAQRRNRPALVVKKPNQLGLHVVVVIRDIEADHFLPRRYGRKRATNLLLCTRSMTKMMVAHSSCSTGEARPHGCPAQPSRSRPQASSQRRARRWDCEACSDFCRGRALAACLAPRIQAVSGGRAAAGYHAAGDVPWSTRGQSPMGRAPPRIGYGAYCRIVPIGPTAQAVLPLPQMPLRFCEQPLTCGLQAVPFQVRMVPFVPTAIRRLALLPHSP